MNFSSIDRSVPWTITAITAITVSSGRTAASSGLVITGTSLGPSTAARKVKPGNSVRIGSANQVAASVSGQTQYGHRAFEHQPQRGGVTRQLSPLGGGLLLLDLHHDAVCRLLGRADGDHCVGLEVLGRPVVEVVALHPYGQVCRHVGAHQLAEDLHGQLWALAEQLVDGVMAGDGTLR
jgi:hypothetical protein